MSTINYRRTGQRLIFSPTRLSKHIRNLTGQIVTFEVGKDVGSKDPCSDRARGTWLSNDTTTRGENLGVFTIHYLQDEVSYRGKIPGQEGQAELRYSFKQKKRLDDHADIPFP